MPAGVPRPEVYTAPPPIPRVREVMRCNYITVQAGETLLVVHQTMQLARLRHLIVVDGSTLVGIVSYRDLQDGVIRVCAERHAGPGWREAIRQVPVRTTMVPAPIFVSPDAGLDEAARRMVSLGLGCLPVCESEERGPRLVGVLCESDLLRAAWGR